jgi:hypothetical protein
MTWSTPDSIKEQVRRRWDRGDLLRPLVTGAPTMPMRVTLKGPTSGELANRFEEVRTWIANLTSIPHLRVEWREVSHRVVGAQRIPGALWLDSLAAAAALIGKRSEVRAFEGVLEQTRDQEPRLLPWLEQRPLRAVELSDVWPRLLAVVRWRVAHPRPGIYLRQMDLAGVDTKFTAAHRGVLTELLDLVLEPEQVDVRYASTRSFALRYGFMDRPECIRFRILDGKLSSLPGLTTPDVALDAASFASLRLPVKRVIITENEINFLSLPSLSESIAVFGRGYGWDALAQAQWLHECEMLYWGDIDTHGFAILDQLRSRFPHVESILMDEATLRSHEPLWGEEGTPVLHNLPRLTVAEQSVYDVLRQNRFAPALRLEQERISFHWVESVLRKLDARQLADTV